MIRTLAVVFSLIAATLVFVIAIVTLNPAAAFEGFLLGANGILAATQEDSPTGKS